MSTKKILILGAGKSATYLIDYLIDNAPNYDWQVTVGDISAAIAALKTKNRARSLAVSIDTNNLPLLAVEIQKSDLVISMLPAFMHLQIAKICLEHKKHLLTPSYLSEEMLGLQEEVKKQNLIFLNEMGLDPGIDHLSAFLLFDEIHRKGGKITAFQSHCGGLVAPESDTNPCHYKFSWNPRNVILAGQGAGGIKWREQGEIKEISYQNLFSNTKNLTVKQNDKTFTFESYPNRDSLKYLSIYHLEEVETIYRGTLRVPPFCSAWNWLVENKITQETSFDYDLILKKIEQEENPIIKTLLKSMELEKTSPNFEENAAHYLQRVLEDKWKMQPTDKDWVVMIHEIDFTIQEKKQRVISSFLMEGKDGEHTAMALTVGLPLAIAAKLILTNQIQERGVLMPNFEAIYKPVMQELETYGVVFQEVWS